MVGKILVPKVNKNLVSKYYYRGGSVDMMPHRNKRLRDLSNPTLVRLRRRTRLGNFRYW